MAVFRENSEVKDIYETIVHEKKCGRPYRLTPYIVTICEGSITEIDLRNFLEAGLRIVRFKMTHVARKDKVVLLSMLKRAITWCCDKYVVSTWPVAISIDLPNACIRTGYLKEEINNLRVLLEEGKVVEVTSEVKYWNQCDSNLIFVDDPFTLRAIVPNTEISINFGTIIMICIEVISDTSIKCKVVFGGYLSNGQFVCVRGIKLLRPTLSRLDKQLLAFVRDYELDFITIHSIRKVETLRKVRAFFRGSRMPMIISTICEQEGLDNLDEIISESDGLILAREFLSQSLLNDRQLITIQLHVSARCRQLGKPFYVSGTILEDTLKWGTTSCRELHDVTNAVLQGAGLVLKSYANATNLLHTMYLLNSVCRVVETIYEQNNFWRFCSEFQPPATAAEGIILACALTAKQTGSLVIIVLTVTGRTAMQLARVEPDALILSISANPRVARQLLLYRGIMPIIYDKEPLKHWHHDMNARVEFAVSYGLTHDLLKYNQTYVVLRKSEPTSAFCDQVSLWNVVVEETKKKSLVCPEHPPVNN